MKSSPNYGNGGTRFWGQFQDDPDKCIYYCSLGGYKECSGKNKSTDQLYYCWGGEVTFVIKFVRFWTCWKWTIGIFKLLEMFEGTSLSVDD